MTPGQGPAQAVSILLPRQPLLMRAGGRVSLPSTLGITPNPWSSISMARGSILGTGTHSWCFSAPVVGGGPQALPPG